MAQYKLNYFNFRGRGEVIRLIFAAAGQKFEDNRFESSEWPQMKAKSPFGTCPWLEIHDAGNVTLLGQSPTIARYLARKFRIAGKNELEAAEIEMYADQLFDLQTEIISAHFGSDPERQKVLKEKLFNQSVPFNLGLIEARLGKTGSGHFAASGFSWVDLHLVNILEFFGDQKDTILANFKLIKALDQKVRAMPNIAAWIARRPKSNY